MINDDEFYSAVVTSFHFFTVKLAICMPFSFACMTKVIIPVLIVVSQAKGRHSNTCIFNKEGEEEAEEAE